MNKCSYVLKKTCGIAKFMFSYLAGKTTCRYPPPILMIEPTNECNLRCEMCMRDKMNRRKGYLSFDLFKSLFDANPEISRIVFCGHGEPLFHPEICKMINYAAAKKIRTELNTNAILLNASKSKEIINSGLNSIAFSFDALDEEEYRKIRDGADYKQTLNNIDNFILASKKYPRREISINVDCIDFNYSFQKKINFRTKFNRSGIKNINFIPLHTWPGGDGDVVHLERNHKKTRSYPCFLPWIMLCVLWDGRVSACCDDFDGANIVGELSDNLLIGEIWNGEKVRLLRAKMLSGNQGGLICLKCDRMKKNPWKYPILDKIKRELKELFINDIEEKNKKMLS